MHFNVASVVKQRGIMRGILLAAAALMSLLCVSAVHAQAVYPAKPVTFVVGFPPGTATDSVGRVLAERFSTRLGQSFVIDNKPGQGGSVGAAAAVWTVGGFTTKLSA